MANTIYVAGQLRTEAELVREAYGAGLSAVAGLASKVAGAIESLDARKIKWTARDAYFLAKEGTNKATEKVLKSEKLKGYAEALEYLTSPITIKRSGSKLGNFARGLAGATADSPAY